MVLGVEYLQRDGKQHGGYAKAREGHHGDSEVRHAIHGVLAYDSAHVHGDKRKTYVLDIEMME